MMYGILLLEQLYDNEIFTWNLPLGVSLSDYRSSANHNQSYKVIRFGYKKILVLFDMCLQICNMQAEFELESFTFQQIQRKGILPNLLVLMQTTIAHWMFLGKKNFLDTISISYGYYWYMHIEMLVHTPAKKMFH